MVRFEPAAAGLGVVIAGTTCGHLDNLGSFSSPCLPVSLSLLDLHAIAARAAQHSAACLAAEYNLSLASAASGQSVEVEVLGTGGARTLQIMEVTHVHPDGIVATSSHGRTWAFDRDGEIVETSPARGEVVASIALCLATKGGVALFIDYGHERSGAGDTLQAVKRHRFAPVLDKPGEQDLTAHVDFEAIARAAVGAGAAVTPVTSQGEWLIRLGIESRAQALSRTNPEWAAEIEGALHRLTSPDEMGRLFKVIAVHSLDWPAPAGFA